MSDDKTAVKSVITRLYQRISYPTAKDARVRDIGLRALEELAPSAPPFDYNSLNINDARKAVEDGLISRDEALVKEKAGKNRAKLVKWLEGEED